MVHIGDQDIGVGDLDRCGCRTAAPDEIGREAGAGGTGIQIQHRCIVDCRDIDRGGRYHTAKRPITDHHGDAARGGTWIVRGIQVGNCPQSRCIVAHRRQARQGENVVVRAGQSVGNSGWNRTNGQHIARLPVGQRDSGARQTAAVIGKHLVGIGNRNTRAVFNKSRDVTGPARTAIQIKNRCCVDRSNWNGVHRQGGGGRASVGVAQGVAE